MTSSEMCPSHVTLTLTLSVQGHTVFMFTSAFMFFLGGSFPILLPLCNPVIPPLAVSCFIIIFISDWPSKRTSDVLNMPLLSINTGCRDVTNSTFSTTWCHNHMEEVLLAIRGTWMWSMKFVVHRWRGLTVTGMNTKTLYSLNLKHFILQINL